VVLAEAEGHYAIEWYHPPPAPDLPRRLVRLYDSKGGFPMRNEFTAIIERDGEWFIAYCPEIPGANGQGKNKEEARESLAEAIALILEDRREEGLRGVPPEAIRETITIP